MIPLNFLAQKREFNFTIASGADQVFMSGLTHQRPGKVFDIGFRAVLPFGKGERMLFNPGIHYRRMEHRSLISEHVHLNMETGSIDLEWMLLFRTKKRSFFRAGFETAFKTSSTPIVEVRGIYFFSNEDYYKGFDPTPFQVRAALAWSCPFSKRENGTYRYRFNVVLTQDLNSPVNSPYKLYSYTEKGLVTALNGATLPTALTVGLEYNLNNRKKKE